MPDTIPDIHISRKTQDFLGIIAIILLGLLSFGLGRLSAQEQGSVDVLFCDASQAHVTGQVSGVQDTSTSFEAQATTGTYVGSKNGSVYHFPWCSGAQRIKEENKVWFSSKEEAENAGYRPAANCKGL